MSTPRKENTVSDKKAVSTKEAKAKIERSGPREPANPTPDTRAETMLNQGAPRSEVTPGS